MSQDNLKKIKISFLGDCFVGKTSIITRIYKGIYDPTSLQSTPQLNCYDKEVAISDEKIILNFWDVPGQQKLADLAKPHYRDANLFVFVYDVTNSETYDNINKWNDPDLIDPLVPKIIFGNKTDLPDHKITASDQRYADIVKAHIQGSAQLNENIDFLVDLIKDFYLEDENQKKALLASQKKKCC